MGTTRVFVGLVSAIIAAAATLWATGTVALAAGSFLLLAVGVPASVWEWQHAAQAQARRRRERRIAELAPLAKKLGLTPQTLGDATPESLTALTPDQFEDAMALLLTALGYRNVSVTSKVNQQGNFGDHGIDLMGLDPHGQPFVGQCKRWQTATVGEPNVRDFLVLLR
jgi:restriction endonuclease Mrr